MKLIDLFHNPLKFNTICLPRTEGKNWTPLTEMLILQWQPITGTRAGWYRAVPYRASSRFVVFFNSILTISFPNAIFMPTMGSCGSCFCRAEEPWGSFVYERRMATRKWEAQGEDAGGKKVAAGREMWQDRRTRQDRMAEIAGRSAFRGSCVPFAFGLARNLDPRTRLLSCRENLAHALPEAGWRVAPAFLHPLLQDKSKRKYV